MWTGHFFLRFILILPVRKQREICSRTSLAKTQTQSVLAFSWAACNLIITGGFHALGTQLTLTVQVPNGLYTTH